MSVALRIILVTLAIVVFGTYFAYIFNKVSQNNAAAFNPSWQAEDIKNLAHTNQSEILENIEGTSSGNYYYTVVATSAGRFSAYVVKYPTSSVTVKTVSANASDCKKDCPTKPLAQYAKENGAVAAINGSYFCPPDYPSCKDKKNSYDFALYNSNKGKWINKKALSWNKTGMFVAKGRSLSFYTDTSKASKSGVSAALSNYPMLLKGGNIVVNNLTAPQKVRGTRSAFGTGGGNIYLAIITNATVTEAAYVMKGLGATEALNLDGGGSSALYFNGYYKFGPGRGLPNAIVLVR